MRRAAWIYDNGWEMPTDDRMHGEGTLDAIINIMKYHGWAPVYTQQQPNTREARIWGKTEVQS